MRKTGFTLIELLAVITILAIILLIAVPIVLRLTKDSKKSTAKESLEMYERAIENAISNYFMKNSEEDEVTMEDLQQGNYIQYKGPPITCEEVQIYKDNVYLANCKMKEDYIDATYGKHVPEETMLKKNYIGYYADVNGDGNVDGVIYADLAHSKSGKWGPYSNYIDNGTYSYEAKDNLKEYTISENKYTEGKFGKKEIIKVKPGSTGNSRFYVMALENFETENYKTFYYYANGADYDSSCACWKGRMNPKITKEEFGEGKENTRLMINKWNASGTSEGYEDTTQDNQDIWKHIQNKYREGWNIPSVGEWAAFADYLSNRLENPLTTSNYNTIYGLSVYYWSSSQYSEVEAWAINFLLGAIYQKSVSNDVVTNSYVRLSSTF